MHAGGSGGDGGSLPLRAGGDGEAEVSPAASAYGRAGGGDDSGGDLSGKCRSAGGGTEARSDYTFFGAGTGGVIRTGSVCRDGAGVGGLGWPPTGSRVLREFS